MRRLKESPVFNCKVIIRLRIYSHRVNFLKVLMSAIAPYGFLKGHKFDTILNQRISKSLCSESF